MPSAADSLSLKALLQALRRLQPNQGDRARRNARTDVLARLRRLRAFVDEVYPAPAVKALRTRKRRRPNDLPTHVEVSSDDYGTKVAKAGIRTTPAGYSSIIVPIWVRDVRPIKPTIEQLRRAHRSWQYRRSLLAQARLTKAVQP